MFVPFRVTLEAPSLKPMIWLAIGLSMPFSVRVRVGFVATAVFTQYLIGATLIDPVGTTAERIRERGRNQRRIVVADRRQAEGIVGCRRIGAVVLGGSVCQAGRWPRKPRPRVRMAVVISVPDVPTWTKMIWLPAVNPPPVEYPERSCAWVVGAIGAMSIVDVPVPLVPVVAGVAHPAVPGAT